MKIKEAIIVEGKYDKIKLSSIVDTIIIETNGFRIFKDKKKLNIIRKLAQTNGIIIFTDSDAAGFVIRNHLKTCIQDGIVKHAYIPDIYGKEKRKNISSKEGKLGVEGIDNNIILNILKKSSIKNENCANDSQKITKQDFFELGLYGQTFSKEKRKSLISKFNLPEYISTNDLIKIINSYITYEKFIAFFKQ